MGIEQGVLRVGFGVGLSEFGELRFSGSGVGEGLGFRGLDT